MGKTENGIALVDPRIKPVIVERRQSERLLSSLDEVDRIVATVAHFKAWRKVVAALEAEGWRIYAYVPYTFRNDYEAAISAVGHEKIEYLKLARKDIPSLLVALKEKRNTVNEWKTREDLGEAPAKWGLERWIECEFSGELTPAQFVAKRENVARTLVAAAGIVRGLQAPIAMRPATEAWERARAVGE